MNFEQKLSSRHLRVPKSQKNECQKTSKIIAIFAPFDHFSKNTIILDDSWRDCSLTPGLSSPKRARCPWVFSYRTAAKLKTDEPALTRNGKRVNRRSLQNETQRTDARVNGRFKICSSRRSRVTWFFFWSHLLKFRKINDACTWIRLNFNMQILSEAYFIINHNRNVSKTSPNPPKARRELGVKFYWAKPKAKNVHTLILWSKNKMKIVFRKKPRSRRG